MFSDIASQKGGNVGRRGPASSTGSIRPQSAQPRMPTCTKNSSSTYFAAVKLPKQQQKVAERNASVAYP